MNPIKALYYSAVINGLVAVPIIVIMMLIAADSKVMGQFKVGGWLSYLGWATAIVMALASVAMIIQTI
jgi:Mn2+/Fe2+ NRAMP family transporter